MRDKSTAIESGPVALSGLGWAGLAVVAFSGTVPATVLALRDMDPLVVGAGRSVLAALLAMGALLAGRAALPRRSQLQALLLVALGCGIGFGVLSAIALRDVSASHAAVIIGLLPMATAAAAVVRGGERASPLFWLANAAGSVAVVAYAWSDGVGSVRVADGLLLLALVIAAVGYAEGGRLAREMPGWQVIAWGVVFALPVSAPLTGIALATSTVRVGAASLGGFVYVGTVSMFVGFFAWYHGLARAGVSRGSQLQLLQPFLTLVWAALILGDHPGIAAPLTAIVVLVCVAVAQRARFSLAIRPVMPPA
jgi:drug/metabolite transporter (DMT)-like permease